jgi:maltooligosyltrehalose trehalohydrolase
MRWITMIRGSVLVACNFADAAQRIPCADLGGKEIVLSSEEGIIVEDNTVLLPGQAVVILDECEKHILQRNETQDSKEETR